MTHPAIGVSTGGNTANQTGTVFGTYVLQGGNNITLSQITGASGSHTVVISAGAGGGGFQSAGMSNIGNTSGTTGLVSAQLVLAGGNNVTLSQSVDGGSATVTISAFNQTGSQYSAGVSTGGNTAGDTGLASQRLVFAGGNNITLSGSTNGGSATYTISAFTQSVESQSFGMSNLGNTSGTTGIASGGQVRFLLAGGNNITLSQSLNGASGTITISAGAGGAGGTNTIGMSNLGNTSGTSGVATGSAFQFAFAGGNNITLSQSLNGSSGTITISGPNAAVAPTLTYWDNAPWGNTVSGGMGSFAFTNSHRSLFVAHMEGFYEAFPGNITANTFYLNLSLSGSTATMSASCTSHIYLGIYTRNGSSLSLLNSASTSWGTGAVNANFSTQIVGQRFLSFDSSQWSSAPAFIQGSDYFVAWFWSSAGSLNQTGNALGFFRYSTVQRSGTVGTSIATATSMGWAPFYGIYTATTGALPTSIGSNQLNKVNAAAGFVPHMVMNNMLSSF